MSAALAGAGVRDVATGYPSLWVCLLLALETTERSVSLHRWTRPCNISNRAHATLQHALRLGIAGFNLRTRHCDPEQSESYSTKRKHCGMLARRALVRGSRVAPSGEKELVGLMIQQLTQPAQLLGHTGASGDSRVELDFSSLLGAGRGISDNGFLM